MPMKKTWLLRVTQIRQDLLALDVPVLDRQMFEHLFHLRARRAQQVMSSLGGYQTGHAFLIERTALLRQLEALEAGTEFAIERGRQQRLQECSGGDPPAARGRGRTHSGFSEPGWAIRGRSAGRYLPGAGQSARVLHGRRGSAG